MEVVRPRLGLEPGSGGTEVRIYMRLHHNKLVVIHPDNLRKLQFREEIKVYTTLAHRFLYKRLRFCSDMLRSEGR